jgi:hypothetical protein
MRHLLGYACLGLLLSSPVVCAQLPVFGWEYRRSLNAEAFLLSAESAGSRVSWQTAPSAAGACTAGGTPDTYCTRLPTCPPLGAVTFTVVAVVASEPSPPSLPPLQCQVTSQTPCSVGCTNPPGGTAGGPGALDEVPTTGAAGTVFPTNAGRVILDVPPVPTEDVAGLPRIEPMPALPLFQPAARAAPF